jgi:hypothetical protein
MAIGDTVQAGLGRMDFSAFQRAGEAQARANQAFGNAIGSVAKSYFDKKAKQKEAENLRQGLELLYPDAPPDLINSMSKDRTLIEAKRNKDLTDFRAQEFAMRQEAFKSQQAMLEEDKQATDRFITMLTSQAPTGKLNEAGQDNLERGSLFLAPGPEAQEEYRSDLLQDPKFQQTEPVMGMSGNRFMAQFANESPAVQERALAFMQAEQKRRAEQATAGMEDFATLRKAEADMRKEFNALDATKDFGDVRTAFLKVKTAAENPSAAGDLALVFNYMKILDPGSVVREGEFQTAADATSWLQRTEDDGFAVPLPIAKAIRKLEDGTLLTPNQRQDFLSTARNTASAQFKPAKEALQRYKGLAANSGLRADQIIPSNYLQIEEELSPSKPQGPGIDTKQGNYTIPEQISVEAQ